MLRSALMAVLSSPVSKHLWPRWVAGILGTASDGVLRTPSRLRPIA